MAPNDGSTRRRILEAALEIAGGEGLGALTTRRVAVEAEVNLGLLHYYFKSKKALVAETFQFFLDELLESSLAIDGRELAPEERLVVTLSSLYSSIEKRRGLLFGMIGRVAETLTTASFEDIDPAAKPMQGPAFPLAAIRRIQSTLMPGIGAYLGSQLGEGKPELIKRRSLQLILSVFNPLLFTDLPRLAFGYDLRDGETRMDYLREVVRDAARA